MITTHTLVVRKINNLIYPIPERDGLGIHVTIDLSGQIKFGPSAYPVKEIDYSLDLSRKSKFLKSIKSYWPNIRSELIQPSYSGIRPKLRHLIDDDFRIIKTNVSSSMFLSVLGYESPGLSASLGLARYIQKIIKNN